MLVPTATFDHGSGELPDAADGGGDPGDLAGFFEQFFGDVFGFSIAHGCRNRKVVKG